MDERQPSDRRYHLPDVPNAKLALGIGTLTAWLLLAAVVGAIAVSGEDSPQQAVAAGGTPTSLPGALDDGRAGEDAAASSGNGTAGGAEAPGGGTATGAIGSDPAAPTSPAGGAAGPTSSSTTTPPSQGGDRTGVTPSEVRIGLHAPVTIDGVPLNLAEDVLKGFETYMAFLNESGGVNGRKIEYRIEDDRFTTQGARTAADRLINDYKAFLVEGTLGADQIAVVAAEAGRRNVPYMAAGTYEPRSASFGMFQLATSYDTHARKLAEFMCASSRYRDKRVGVLVSDSPEILPVAGVFRDALAQRCDMEVVSEFRNRKPQDETRYNDMILQFRGDNVEVLVPLTDPLTTQRIVQQCANGAACGWDYTFSNFAHDGDTVVTVLARPTWGNLRVQGLSGACHYKAPEVEDATKCAAMRHARDQYIAKNGQDDWDENGSGASAGYQLVYFWHKALLDAGADLTRERFLAGLRNYDNYSNLVTGPITFRGSTNIAHGAEKMTVLEAKSDSSGYRMISPGLVDGF